MDSSYDSWAEIYDTVYSYVSDDIPFYVSAALESQGPVLELGCGTGRVAIPVAEAGVDVVGLDSSHAMLGVARQKARRLKPGSGSLELVHGDMRSLSLSRLFDLVIIPFRGFLALHTVEDQIATLNGIRRHINTDGRLAFNIFVPDPEMLVQAGDIPYHFRDVADPKTGEKTILWQQSRYDNHNQIINVRLIGEMLDIKGTVVKRFYRDFQLRYVFRWEMEHLLDRCSFEIVALYGDFDGSDFDEFSTEMIWVVKPK